MPSAFNPDGQKEYQQDLPEWKTEGRMLGAVEMLVVHDADTNEYYPAFAYSEEQVESLKVEYNAPDSAQKIEDVISL